MSGCKDIAEFARNEMVRADHTISWAGEVQSASVIGDAWGFPVRYDGKIYFVTVWKRPE